MYKVAILDDEKNFLEEIHNCLQEYEMFEVSYFQEAKLLIDEIDYFDVVYIDYEMENMTAFEFFKETQMSKYIRIIITKYDHIVYKSIDYDIFDLTIKKYLKEEFQLNKHIWFFVMITLVAIIFLDLYTFNEYLMNQMRLSSIICLYVVSLMMIVLIYILCLEMTQYYQRLMNRKIHEQALQYEETLVEIANQKSKKYNKIIHDYKKLVKDLKENQEIELQDISLEIPTEVIHTNNIVLNYVFNRYTEIMKEHQIDFYGTYSDQIYQGVSSYDLATILKLLLDHAIVLSQKTTHKAIHYTIESQRYYTIIKIRCLIENEIVVDHHFKKNEYLIEEICRKYNGKKLSKIEDNQYMFGCYLENSGDLL